MNYKSRKAAMKLNTIQSRYENKQHAHCQLNFFTWIFVQLNFSHGSIRFLKPIFNISRSFHKSIVNQA